MLKRTSIGTERLTILLCSALAFVLVFSFIPKPRIATADDAVDAVFSNSTPITINTVTVPTVATPYPSIVSVSGMTGTTTKVIVTLNGLSHTRASDIDMLLVSPTGATYVMMSDAGGNVAANNVTLTLDDTGASNLPQSSALSSGTFRPTSWSPTTDVFPAPAPVAPYVSAFTDGAGTLATVFNGADPNGNWSLYIADDSVSFSGTLAGGWGLNITTSGSAATQFNNTGSIAINDVGTSVAAASPYPSTIDVSGMTGVVTDVNVTLTGLSHTRPGDIDVLLMSPNGVSVLLMSDAPVSSSSAISNLTFTFDDAAANGLPNSGPLVSGTYRPTDFNTGTDSFPSPAPSGPYTGGTMATFNNFSPNGTWRLFIVDDLEGESGSLSGGWSLDVTTAPSVPPVLGCGTASFSGPTTFAVGAGPTGVAKGNFNNDANTDLVVTNQSSNNVSVLLGDGLGGFSAATNFVAGSNPYAVEVGLINNDANQDLVVVNSGSNSISILMGDGLGGFSAATNYGTGPSPISVAVGDLNNDTKPDLVVAEFGGFFAGTASVFLNSGTGTFGPAIVLAARTQPSFAAIGEFNGDSNRDLAVANFGSNNVSIFLGNGNGTFVAAPVVTVGTGPVSIAIGDLNADTKDDLAVANYNSDNISIRMGVGNGNFTPVGNISVGANPISVKLGEFSTDGKPDLAVANRSSNNVSVLLGTGTGAFGAPNNFAVGTAPSSIVIGEFNGNSLPDVATANAGSGDASVLLNSCAVARGNRFDFTGDRRTDLAVFRPTNTTWYVLFSEGGGGFSQQIFGAATDILVPEDYTGDGKTDMGVFRPSTSTWIVSGVYNIPFGLPGDIPAPSDFDGDSRADIAVFRPSDGNWYIRRSLDNMWLTIPFGTNGDKPIPRDYDGDGKSDVAVFRPSTGAWYILRSSDSQVVGLQFGISTDRPVAADYDGDGKADVAVFRASDGGWYILRSSDSAFVALAWGISTDIPTPGDYDGDGKFDVAIYRPSTGYWYVLRSSSGTLQATPWGVSTDIPIPSTNVP